MPLTRTLVTGLKGEDVTTLQKALRALNIIVEDRKGDFSDGTRRAVLEFQRRNQLRATGSFGRADFNLLISHLGDDPFRDLVVTPGRPDPDQPEPIRPDRPVRPVRPDRQTFDLVVTGVVLQPDGKPVANAVIAGISKGIIATQDKEIAKAKTDADGRYTFKAKVPDGGTDLVVELRAKRGTARITRSPLVLGAIGSRTVDLVVDNSKAYPRPSEFSELQRRLEPLLDGIDDPAALDIDTITVLHAKTGLSPVRITHFLKAVEFARRGGPDAEIYYGLFRANLPANGPALAALEDTVLTRAIRTAAEAGVINIDIARSARKIDEMVKAVNAAEVETILNQPDLSNGTASLATFLGVTGLGKRGQRSFVDLAQTHTGTSAEFWEKLSEQPDIGADGRRRLETAAKLSVLTLGNTALMKLLFEDLSNKDEPLRALATLSRDDWEGLIDQLDGDGLPLGFMVGGDQRPKPVYARMMARMIEDAYPTSVFAARLGNEDFNDASTVSSFLRRNPDFDLATKSLRTFAAEREIEIDPKTRDVLEGVQRVFALAPRFERYETVRPILARGLTSAYAIRAMGETQFLRTFSEPLGESQARRVFENAQAKTAVATTLIGRYGAGFNNVAMNVLPAWDIADIIGKLHATYPTVDEATWEGLFGNVDFCSCEHCNSVYSPAAYMVALLKFLRDRGLLADLNARRPEIGALHLTCDNTNITLPYVDLVIEILEGFVTNTPAEHSLVAAELSGASAGIGFRLQDARQFIRTDRMFVGLIQLGILGALLDAAFAYTGRRLVHWENA